jgi:hypothetical protein
MAEPQANSTRASARLPVVGSIYGGLSEIPSFATTPGLTLSTAAGLGLTPGARADIEVDGAGVAISNSAIHSRLPMPHTNGRPTEPKRSTDGLRVEVGSRDADVQCRFHVGVGRCGGLRGVYKSQTEGKARGPNNIGARPGAQTTSVAGQRFLSARR